MPLSSKGRLVTAISVATLIPMALSAGLTFATRRMLELPEAAKAVRAHAQHAPTERGCLSRGPFDPKTGDACWWNQEAEGAPLYLVGDSNAWQFAEGVIDAAQSLRRPAWIFTTHSCPLIEGVKIAPQGRSRYFEGPWPANEFTHCAAYARYTVDWLASARPGTVLIAALDQYWWDPTLLVALNDRPGVAEQGAKIELLREGLSAVVSRLQARGHHVILVQTIPTFRNPPPIWEPRRCTTVSILDGACARSVPVATIDEFQRPSRDALTEVARQTNAHVLDLRESLCTGGQCNTHRSGAWVYMDATHLTIDASRTLAPQFAAAISTPSK